ncbi:rhamnosyltransferase WsaF family glycosyltransferase [Agreia sp. Leaf210]|uniref:rhamnosyltransferase WsaF family glycosyltransferase n=1 Tax=Agreia sp. Leaf210 TaxID=1735682 RepID=UPI0006FBFB31|nr:hypothetical protein [Agreia sp. Leaf210]KQM60568.1 hypothetical protein ASE64_02505 [Agreia sp. Leaf210]
MRTITLSAFVDYLRISRAYMLDSSFRLALRRSLPDRAALVASSESSEEIHAADVTPQKQREQDEALSANNDGNPYAGLTATSMALVNVSTTASVAALNVIFLEVRPYAIFAGVKTALEVASALALALDVQLRIVLVQSTGLSRDDEHALQHEIRDHVTDQGFVDSALEVSVVGPSAISTTEFGSADFWLATHWSTAHALDVACRSRLIDRSRCAYLIQDYEPGFNTWSTEFTLARATYHAGFVPIVNSVPLAEYLRKNEGAQISDRAIFAPAFDLDDLRRTYESRQAHPRVRIFYYGRPSKPRNLYSLGISALRLAAQATQTLGIPVEFFMAGEAGPDVELMDGMTMKNLGALAREDYFTFLSTVDVGLSLQYSPHPSHPPFDLALSGALAVTNEFDGRTALHANMILAPTDPDELAIALIHAVERSIESQGGTPSPYEWNGHQLGACLRDVINETVAIFDGRDSTDIRQKADHHD